MSGRSFLFVHSPLVGPSSLRRLARVALAAGNGVALPDLTPFAMSSKPHDEFCRLAVEAGISETSPLTIVGHSGAGTFLPAIGAAIASDAHLIFVDAVLPPPTGAHATSSSMLAALDEQTDTEGLLRPWLSWWPDDVVAELLPDAEDRQVLRADMPQLPRSFYDVGVDVPTGWSGGSCGYLQLSEAYADASHDAAQRGWPVACCASTHLGVHTEADRVFAAILELDEALR